MRWVVMTMLASAFVMEFSYPQAVAQTTELSAPGAKQLVATVAAGSMVELPKGITSLSPGAAEQLAKSSASVLWLRQVETISGEVAAELTAFKGTLYLDGLKSLTLKEAKVLATHAGGLSLTGLQDLDPDVYDALRAKPFVLLNWDRVVKKRPQENDPTRFASATPALPAKGGGQGAREIKLKQIEIFGNELVGKVVFVRDCSFMEISNDVGFVPGVEVSTNGLISQINVRERGRWIKILCGDSSDTVASYCYASKETLADFFLSLKRDDRFDCEGLVTELNGVGGRKGLWILKATRRENDK